MLTQIQDKVIEKIRNNIKPANKTMHLEPLDAMLLDVKRMVSPINIFVAIDTGDFSPQTQNTKSRFAFDIDIYMVFRDTKKEEGRRKGIYPIIEGITRLLLYDYLDMKEKITHLVPVSLRNVTNREFAENNLMGFLLKFRSSFIFTINEVDAPDLLITGLNYYLGGIHEEPAETSDLIRLGDHKGGKK